MQRRVGEGEIIFIERLKNLPFSLSQDSVIWRFSPPLLFSYGENKTKSLET